MGLRKSGRNSLVGPKRPDKDRRGLSGVPSMQKVLHNGVCIRDPEKKSHPMASSLVLCRMEEHGTVGMWVGKAKILPAVLQVAGPGVLQAPREPKDSPPTLVYF